MAVWGKVCSWMHWALTRSRCSLATSAQCRVQGAGTCRGMTASSISSSAGPSSLNQEPETVWNLTFQQSPAHLGGSCRWRTSPSRRTGPTAPWRRRARPCPPAGSYRSACKSLHCPPLSPAASAWCCRRPRRPPCWSPARWGPPPGPSSSVGWTSCWTSHWPSARTPNSHRSPLVALTRDWTVFSSPASWEVSPHSWWWCTVPRTSCLQVRPSLK